MRLDDKESRRRRKPETMAIGLTEHGSVSSRKHCTMSSRGDLCVSMIGRADIEGKLETMITSMTEYGTLSSRNH